MTVMPAAAAVRVRCAKLSDLNDLVTLERVVFDSDRISRAQFRRYLKSDSARVLVASAGRRRFVGAAIVFFRKSSRVARLYSIASLPQARGKSVGTVLIEAAEAAARQQHCLTLRLEVRTDNAKAMKLYERLGYHRCSTLKKGFYEDGSAAFVYEKGLAADKSVCPSKCEDIPAPEP